MVVFLKMVLGLLLLKKVAEVLLILFVKIVGLEKLKAQHIKANLIAGLKHMHDHGIAHQRLKT